MSSPASKPPRGGAQRSYLAWHGQQWRVQVAVPRPLRPIIGTAVLFHPLHTDSLSIANRDKHRHIHALKQRLAAAEAELRRRNKTPIDPLVTEAIDWREKIEEEATLGGGGPYAPDTLTDLLRDRYSEVVQADGEERAEMLRLIATGRATPLSVLADKWLSEKPVRPRQKLDYRRAVANLEAWLLSKELATTLEAVTKRVVADYKAEAFIKAGMHPRTANKSLSVLSGLWKYAAAQGIGEGENPWRGQFLTGATTLVPTITEGRVLPFLELRVERMASAHYLS